MQTVKVELPQAAAQSYPIYIGSNILERAGKYVKSCANAEKLLIVSNTTVYPLYGEQVKNALLQEGFKVNFLLLEDGEQYKNIDSLEKIWAKAIELRLERKDAMVALGGGVVGDITGFAAATYLRGIDFIQIPTTLLAQVDSSVGGKVAVNHQSGKNLIGNFYRPKAVITDLTTLNTLSDAELKVGLAEVLKYCFIEKSCGLSELMPKQKGGSNLKKSKLIEESAISENRITNAWLPAINGIPTGQSSISSLCRQSASLPIYYNKNFAEYLRENKEKIMAHNTLALEELIKYCCELKASVVNKDEREAGLRAILNFGHTIGHAIEKSYNYTNVNHGEAVAIGMRGAFFIARKKGLVDNEYSQKCIDLLEYYDMSYKINSKIKPEDLYEAMQVDKKVKSGKIRFVLPTDNSEVEIFDDITKPQVITAIKTLY